MDNNSNNVKINKSLIVVIVVLILALIGAGIYIAYDARLFSKDDVNTITNNVVENNTSNIEENVVENNVIVNDVNENTQNKIISIATKSSTSTRAKRKIYAIRNDGTEIELLDTSEYNTVYTYSAGKLYIWLNKYTSGTYDVNTSETTQKSIDYNILGYIDLNNDNYSFTKLADINAEGSPESIAVANNNIYYTSTTGMYKYDINTNNSSILTDFDFNTNDSLIYLYTISNDKIGYMTSGTSNESPTVGVIDITTNTKKEISSNGSIEYTYNGKIIYEQFDTNNYSKWKYFEYDINNQNLKQISDVTSSAMSSTYDSYIIPKDNYYIYANRNMIYKYVNNNSEKLYEFDGDIKSISLLSNNTLNIVYGPFNGTNVIFDLKELKEIDTQEQNLYSQVEYIY